MQADRLITVTGATVRGVVYGILGTAVVQGILTAFGLWISGVPRPVLLGSVAGLLAVLPIGAPLVWIPASIWLLGSGHLGWGIFLAIYGVGAISGSDSLIRPWFIARGAQLPFLLTVLGVLGGALAFGLLGIFLGPVLLGIGYTLVNEWARGTPIPERRRWKTELEATVAVLARDGASLPTMAKRPLSLPRGRSCHRPRSRNAPARHRAPRPAGPDRLGMKLRGPRPRDPDRKLHPQRADRDAFEREAGPGQRRDPFCRAVISHMRRITQQLDGLQMRIERPDPPAQWCRRTPPGRNFLRHAELRAGRLPWLASGAR